MFALVHSDIINKLPCHLFEERIVMARRERITPVDTAWLRMDHPNNLMTIVGVMIFAGKLDIDRLKRTLAARLLHYPRFRQKVTSDATGSWWEDDDLFNIDHHLRRTALPGDGGKEELQNLVAELLASPFDHARPLWQFHLIDNYRNGKTRSSAMILRIHHAIGDGIALIGVVLSLTDPDGATQVGEVDDSANGAVEEDEDHGGLWRMLFEPKTGAVIAGIRYSGSLLEKSLSLLTNPGQALDTIRDGAGIAVEIAKLAMMPDDAKTRFKGIPGIAKRVAWSEPILLPEVKAVGKTLGCSINDVLLSAVSGALSAYLTEKGEALGEAGIRALVPVNLRSPGDEGKLGNHFGMVTLELPAGTKNPLARLHETRSRMEELKHSYQATAALTVLEVVGLLPQIVQEHVLDLLASKASVVMTNVPGPRETRFMAGSRIIQQMFWVPQTGNIGMGVSILSYDGKVQFGLVSDAGLVPDPERIIACFAPEFEKLLYLLLHEPDSPELGPEEVEARLSAASKRASLSSRSR